MTYIDPARIEREFQYTQKLLSEVPQCIRDKFDRVRSTETSKYLKQLDEFQKWSREKGRDLLVGALTAA